LVALARVGSRLAVAAATGVGPVPAPDPSERELGLAELGGGGQEPGEGAFRAGDARMLKAAEPKVVHLGLEVGLAVPPPRGSLESLVLPERAVEQLLSGLGGSR